MSDGTGTGLPRRAAAAWRWLPLAGLVAIWAFHLYYSVVYRPDVLFHDDWAVFGIPGYSRAFDLVNFFGTQNDTVAVYQNTVQYLMLVATDLHFPTYVAVQNLFLLAFVLAAWRLLSSMDFGFGGWRWAGSVLAALLLVPAFTGTWHFLGTAMGFNHQMPMVFLVLALSASRTERLGPLRRPLAACLLFLSGAAYLSGWMYLLAATLALALVRVLAPPGPGEPRRPAGLPGGWAVAFAWIALLAVAALSIRLSHRPYLPQLLPGEGVAHAKPPPLWPWDGRFWLFYLATVARGWGLPAGPGWGGAALLATVAPLLALVFRLRRGSRRDAADAFALAAPVLGALFALAMITAGRGLLAGADPAAVAAYARGHPKYLLHMAFALPFVAAAWFRVAAAVPGLRGGRLGAAAAAIAAVHLAGFALGADGRLADRLDFRAIYGRGEAVVRDGGLCIENAVRLARATDARVRVPCPGVWKRDLRRYIAAAERAGVPSIAGIPDRPPISIESVRAAIAAAEAAGASSGGRVDAVEPERAAGRAAAGLPPEPAPALRIAGRTAMLADGRYPDWIAVSVPGRPPWLARVTGGSGANPRAGPAGSFEAAVPAGERPSPAGVRAWALDAGPGGDVAAAFPLLPPLFALPDAPPAAASPGGWIERAVWAPGRRTLEVSGWAMADGGDDGRRISVYAPGAVSVARVEERERPDVVAARGGDARLLRSGFTVVLRFPRSAPEPPCVRVFSRDRAFGRRALRGPPDRDPAACPPAR